MNGPIAQIVALTCHGNSFLAGNDTPTFFPENSTCQFCNSLDFVEWKSSFLQKPKEVVVAEAPDEWFSLLQLREAKGIRLTRTPQSNPQLSDRMSAGFVGGGGTWIMEVLRPDIQSEFWAARWEVWNQNAPANKIWRATYGLVGQDQTKPYTGRTLSAVKQDFRISLESIHSFSKHHQCDGFTQCFADALRALDDPLADVGYHKDLSVPNQLTPEASSILKASMSAWGFGGMGSWNDMGFDGDSQQEYENVSESLFLVLNEAIEFAATSTAP